MKKNKLKQKKGQFLIFSAVFLFLLLLIIYSSKTTTTYIPAFQGNYYTNNLKDQTCIGVISANGSQLPSRILILETDVPTYCSQVNLNCSLNIKNTTQIPPGGNWSLVNYSLYNYTLKIDSEKINVDLKFSC